MALRQCMRGYDGGVMYCLSGHGKLYGQAQAQTTPRLSLPDSPEQRLGKTMTCLRSRRSDFVRVGGNLWSVTLLPVRNGRRQTAIYIGGES